jgi:glycosyltransferase involved in cell wall biosynthesis
MWRNVLARLADRVALEYVQQPGRGWRTRLRRPDVWLSDGHQGSLPVDEPRVVQLHEASLQIPELRAMIEPWFVAEYEQPSRDAAATANRVITPSESSRRQVIDTYGIEPGCVHAVPHGVDRRVFHPDLEGGQEAIAAAGGRAGVPYVLFVSQIHPRKNLGPLREAMAGLAARGFPHLLVIVGTPAADRADSSALMAEARAELPGTPGRVVLLQGLGEQQFAAVMAGCACFCAPSLMEGFGLPTLEAMACGAPVVVSDRGSLPEVVQDAGVIVPPTAEALEEALAAVLDDPERADALGRAASERAAGLSWERTTEGWLAILEQAAQG